MKSRSIGFVSVLGCVLCTLTLLAAQPSAKSDLGRMVGVDQFGRTVTPIAALDSSRQVGMFFWLWIGQPYATGVYDATQILEHTGGKQMLFGRNDSLWSPSGQQHFWGKPLWGYYNSEDEWVIRKQIQMLTLAGVDFIVFDATNAFTYPQVYQKVLQTIDEFIKRGWNAPKIAFYTHSLSLQTTRRLYEALYRPRFCERTWYRVEGKPLLIGYTQPQDDRAEALSRGDTTYRPEPLSQEILDFFHFRRPQWPSEKVSHPDGFAWLEWIYPQPLHTDMMNVAVASHPQVPFSFSLTRGWTNWGRGWDPERKQNREEEVDRGLFFQRQWDHALEVAPATVFVCGWNEWVAFKQLWDGEYMLCDAATKSYSRDLEPMEGGYEDAFYLQLIRNIRAYKGVTTEVQPSDGSGSVRWKGALSQWNRVRYTCVNPADEQQGRDSYGVTQKLRYRQAAPLNQLDTVKVTHDADHLYLYIRWRKPLDPRLSEVLPKICLGTGTPSLKGWEGYEYRIGATYRDGKVSVEQLRPDGTGTRIGQALYRIENDVLLLQIPRRVVALKAQDATSFYFKVASAVAQPLQIMDYYRTGSVMPLGRLSYRYNLEPVEP